MRQVREGGMGCKEFLLELTDAKLRAGVENRFHRRIKESTFGLLKPVETFDFEAVPELEMNCFVAFRRPPLSLSGGTGPREGIGDHHDKPGVCRLDPGLYVSRQIRCDYVT